MGLLDQLVSGALGSQQAGGGQGKLMQLAMQLISNYPGGLQGLIQAFTQAGLGQQIQSWVGTGQNLPVSAAQVTQVLGSGQLKQLADQAGLSQEQAAGGLAELLPKLVDQLTPNGSIQDDLIQKGLGMLGGKLMG